MNPEVWKFEVPVDGRAHVVRMPLPAKVVHVGCQQPGVVAVWAEVTPGSETWAAREMSVYGTGHPVEGVYVGTAFDRVFVWHLYEASTEVAE